MKTFPTKDTELTDVESISNRIKSINRQIDKLENIESRTMNNFDTRHNKIKKLNARKDSLWIARALILRSERK